MAKDDPQFARQGFLTLWALIFLVNVSLILGLVLTSQAAKQQSTLELIQSYNRSTSQIERALRSDQQPSKRARQTLKPGDSPQRLLE